MHEYLGRLENNNLMKEIAEMSAKSYAENASGVVIQIGSLKEKEKKPRKKNSSSSNLRDSILYPSAH
jgi:hypothetical protein